MIRKQQGALGHRSGFSLIEVLISLFILMIVLLGMMSVFLGTTSGIIASRDRERARTIAMSQLDRLEGLPVTEVVAAAGTTQEDNFTVTTDVTDGGVSADVTVTVSWSFDGSEHSTQSVTVTREVSDHD